MGDQELRREIEALREEVAQLRRLEAEVEELRRTLAAAGALFGGVSRVTDEALDVEAVAPGP